MEESVIFYWTLHRKRKEGIEVMITPSILLEQLESPDSPIGRKRKRDSLDKIFYYSCPPKTLDDSLNLTQFNPEITTPGQFSLAHISHYNFYNMSEEEKDKLISHLRNHPDYLKEKEPESPE